MQILLDSQVVDLAWHSHLTAVFLSWKDALVYGISWNKFIHAHTHILSKRLRWPQWSIRYRVGRRKDSRTCQVSMQSINDFIEVSTEWANSNLWKEDWKDSPTSRWTLNDVKRRLYLAVANVNILEGIRFYVSFACSFAFGELKLMEGSAKIISLISRDESQHLNITQKILKKWADGDDPEMQEIAEEEKENVRLCLRSSSRGKGMGKSLFHK